MSVLTHPGEAVNAGSDHKDLALFYCAESHRLHQTHYAKKIYFAKLARQYGATYQEIADTYGVSEAAVRSLLKRNGGEG